MIILGLDPGLGRTGFGALDTEAPGLFLRCGRLTTPPRGRSADRLHRLGEDLRELTRALRPALAVVERIFFGRNSQTAIQTAEARGVLLYVLRSERIPVRALTPLQIKSQLTGYGAATKRQIQTVVSRRLRLTAAPPDDAADALAAALCLADRLPAAARLPAELAGLPAASVYDSVEKP